MKRIWLTIIVVCVSLLCWGQLSTPYSEDFESGTIGQAPSGWTIWHDYAGDSDADAWGIYMLIDNKMIRMNNTVLRSDYTSITLPAIALPAGQTCFFNFDYTHNANSTWPTLVYNQFKARISTDNGANFTDLQSIDNSAGSSFEDPGEMTFMSINLQAYAGETVVLQFWAEANWENGAIFVDNIFVGPVLSCSSPTIASIGNITASGASISWQGSGQGEDEYQWVCVPSGETIDWSEANFTTSTSATLTGLNSNTTYNFYVRSYCSDDEQSQAVSQAFRTNCAALTIAELGMIGFEQVEGFVAGEGRMGNCWTVGNRQSDEAAYTPYISSQDAFAGSYCLQLKAFHSATTNADSAYAILPEIAFGDIADHHMQMQLRKIENIVGTADYADTLWVGVVPSANAGLRNLQIIGYAVNANTAYEMVDISFASYTGTGGYLVLLAATNPYATLSTRHAQFYIDNLVIRKSTTCAQPTDLALGTVGTTDAQISWNGTAANYRVVVAGQRVQDPEAYTDWLFDVNASSTSTTLSGLTPATDYFVYVQALCDGSSHSDFTGEPVSFTTECLPVTTLPWSDDFESVPANTAPHCWIGHTFKGYIYVQDNATEAHNGRRFLSLYGGNDFYGTVVMVLPTVELDLNNTQLSFWTKQSGTTDNHPALEIGVMSNPNDTNTFLTIATLEKSKTYEQYDIPITAPSGYTHIAMRLRTSPDAAEEKSAAAAVCIDDIRLIVKPSCVKPGIPDISNITAESATLSWTGSAANYSVQVLNGNEVLAETTTSATSLLLDNLTPATSYTIDVRMVAHCDESNMSDTLQKTLRFTTECKPISSYPWTEDFEADAVGTVPSCWDNSALVAESQKWRIYDDNGNHCLRFNSETVAADDTATVITPEIVLPADAKTLTFDWKNPSGGDLDLYLQVVGGRRTSLKKALKSQSTWTTETISLSSYTGSTIVLIFKGTSNYGGRTAYLYVDNIEISGPNDVVTSVNECTSTHTARKLLIDGVLFIEVDGVRYDIRGQRVQ